MKITTELIWQYAKPYYESKLVQERENGDRVVRTALSDTEDGMRQDRRKMEELMERAADMERHLKAYLELP